MIKDSYIQQGARKKMLSEIKDMGIKNQSVLDAMYAIPRHYFFEQDFGRHAYINKAFPIDEGQTISQPYTVAYQTELLEIKKNDTILEIGTGSGYQASILSYLSDCVYSIERNTILFNKAKTLLEGLNIGVNLFLGDGSLGLNTFAPYNKILVTAGAPAIPKVLLRQLAKPGILVIPVGELDSQIMKVVHKDENGNISIKSHHTFKFVPLVGEQGWKKK